MKKAGDIMAELGFREDAPESVKRAFIQNLVRAAGGERYKPAPTSASAPRRKTDVREEQLSFNFSDDPGVPFPQPAKRSVG